MELAIIVQGGNGFEKKTYYSIEYLYITPCLAKLRTFDGSNYEYFVCVLLLLKYFGNLVNVVCLDYKYYSQGSSYLKVQYIFIVFYNETIIVIE